MHLEGRVAVSMNRHGQSANLEGCAKESGSISSMGGLNENTSTYLYKQRIISMSDFSI